MTFKAKNEIAVCKDGFGLSKDLVKYPAVRDVKCFPDGKMMSPPSAADDASPLRSEMMLLAALAMM